MPPNKVLIHFAGEDENDDMFAMCSPSRCGRRLVIHETDEEAKKKIKKFTANSDGILYEGEAVDKKILAQKPTDRRIEDLLNAHRRTTQQQKKGNGKSTNMQVITMSNNQKQAPPMSWHRILLYLLVAAPVYIPIICYFAAPVFDVIIDFLKGE